MGLPAVLQNPSPPADAASAAHAAAADDDAAAAAAFPSRLFAKPLAALGEVEVGLGAAATPCAGGCNPMRGRLQPYLLEA